MKFIEKFLILSRGKQIALVVCIVHFFAIFGLTIHHLATRRLKPPRPMIVKTLAALPPQKTIASAPKIASVPTDKPVAKANPKPIAKAAEPKPKAPTPSKKITPSPAAPKAKPAPIIKNAPVKQEEETLLQEIAQSFETLSSEAARTRTAINLPSKIQSKAEIAPSKFDPTYSEILIAYLQNELDLPEYGEVKAKIEIDIFGRLVDCQILEAKSSKNAEFLKNRLPELSFPCLNDSQSFTITFRNVEIN